MTQSSENGSMRKHVRGSSLLLAGRLISVGINFLVQVLIVRFLSKEGYGAFAYGYSIAMLASRFMPLGTDKAISRFVPIFQEEGNLARVKGSLIVVGSTIVVMGILLVGVVVTSRNALASTVVQDPLSLLVLMVIISLAPLTSAENLLEKLLAIFGRVKSLFFRRYFFTPLLRLAAVCCLIAVGGDARFLAAAYVFATSVGVLVSLQILWHALGDEKSLAGMSRVKPDYPTTTLFGFGVPLLGSDVVFGLRTTLVVILLECFHGVTGVAAFRAILPVARLNQIVFESFGMLYVPTASRLYARGEKSEIGKLYWCCSAWTALLTFPVFLISFSLAEPTTKLLFGSAYVSSAPILSIVALGLYINATFGFNALTLRVYNRAPTILKLDLAAGLLAIVLNVATVPMFGPLAGAAVSSLVLLLQNVAYHVVLVAADQMERIPKEIARIYGAIFTFAISLLLFQYFMKPPMLVGLTLAGLGTLLLWWAFLKTLRIREFFPEVDRFLSRYAT